MQRDQVALAVVAADDEDDRRWDDDAHSAALGGHGEASSEPSKAGVGEVRQSACVAGFVDQVSGLDEKRHGQKGEAFVEDVEKFCTHVVEGEAKGERGANHPIANDQQDRHAEHEEKDDDCNRKVVGIITERSKSRSNSGTRG